MVDSIVPGGPAASALAVGDVLVRLNGAMCSSFLTLEEACDVAATAGGTGGTDGGTCGTGGGTDGGTCGTVTVEWERGGAAMSGALRVADLHAVTPASLLELGGGVVNGLSYQQARNFRAAAGQVYVAEPGYLLAKAALPRHAIITKLGGTATPDLDAFAAAVSAAPHGARVSLEYFTFSDRHRKRTAILPVDWEWCVGERGE